MTLRRRLRTTASAARSTWIALGGERRGRVSLERLMLERVLRRPIVFEDERGLRYVLYPGENAGVYLEHGGNYEVAETRLCERLVRRGDVVVDAGAHIGLYTLLFARLVAPGGTVHAFEPEPANFRRLLVNLALNGAEEVVARQLAVFERSGEVTLNLFGEGLPAWHSLGRPELPDPYRRGQTVVPERAVTVGAVALDDYCRDEGIERIDFLKLDVEGAEVDALRGARGLLDSGRIGTILLEVSLPQVASMGHEPEEGFALLLAAGYRIWSIAPDGDLGEEVDAAEERYANYVAARARPDA